MNQEPTPNPNEFERKASAHDAWPEIFSPARFWRGNRTGVLMIHGFTGSPRSIEYWAQGVADAGYTVSLPRLPGHGTNIKDCNQYGYQDWYQEVESKFLELQSICDEVFVAGFSVGGALALRLAQLRSDEIAGLILINASIYDESKLLWLTPVISKFRESIKRGESDVAKPNPPKHSYGRTPLTALNSLRHFWPIVEEDLFFVKNPALIGYSINDHVVHPTCSETIINNIQSNLREIIFESSYHHVALDYDQDVLVDETTEFIQDVLAGKFDLSSESTESENHSDTIQYKSFIEVPDDQSALYQSASIDDERDLINAEFDSIVAGLSLDQSAPTTYLDELEKIADAEKFRAPNPRLGKAKRETKIAGWLFFLAIIYLVFQEAFNIDLFGFGIWPGLLAISASVVFLIYGQLRPPDADPGEFGDGSHI